MTEKSQPSLVNEHSVALAFTKKWGEQMKFDHTSKRWYIWNEEEGRWQHDKKRLAFDRCRSMAAKISDDLKDNIGVQRRVQKMSFARAVETGAANDSKHAVTNEIWDRQSNLLGCPGKVVVDLTNGDYLTAKPNYYITQQTAIEPAPQPGELKLWREFLDQTTGSDEEKIAFLQRWAGYCLTGETKEHALIFLSGRRYHRKSVFLNTLSKIMGDYSNIPAMDTFVESRHDRELVTKLKNEWPEILAWMIEGATCWNVEGWTPPPAKAKTDA